MRRPSRAHRRGDRCPRGLVVEVHADKALGVEVDVILLLRAPLAVVEYHRGDGDALAHAGLQFAEAHAPGAVADVGDRRAVGRGDLGADDGRESVAAIAETHGREHRPGLLEAKVGIGHRADIADVGGHHGRRRQCAFELAQHLPWVHAARVLGDAERPGIGFVRPALEFGLPRRPSRAGLRPARSATLAWQASVLPVQAREERLCGGLGVAADACRDRPDQPQHLGVGVDLDDLGVLRPIVDPVLRQGTEGAQTRAQRQHDVGLGHATSSPPWSPDSRAGRMPGDAVREKNRCADSVLHTGACSNSASRIASLLAVGHDDAAAAEDHREA